jgi:hypothetical protein
MNASSKRVKQAHGVQVEQPIMATVATVIAATLDALSPW